MKKNLLAIIIALTLALLCACSPAGVPDETSAFPATTSDPETTAAPVETEPQIETLDPITLSYDDYVTEIAGILPDAEGVTVEGDAVEVKTVKGVAPRTSVP